MEGQNYLSLKFQNKNSILLSSINQLCYSANLCDVKCIGSDGVGVMMHKLVLCQAFPGFRDILEHHSDNIVIIITEFDSDSIEACREDLYQSGDGKALGSILGFENAINTVKVERNVDAFAKGAPQEYVAMDVVHDYVDIDTLEEMTNISKLSEISENFHSYQNTPDIYQPTVDENKQKKQKKSSFSKLSDVPYYFLKTSKSDLKKGPHGPQGILITHDSAYKFHKNNSSRDYLMTWWQCKERAGPSRCRATATTQSLDGKTYFLRTCSGPDEHIHLPDKLNILKQRLIVDIKMITRNFPTTATGNSNYEKAKNMAVEEASRTYLNDPEVLEKVVASIQDPNFKLNKRINAFKHGVVSKINKELAASGFSFSQL